MKAGIIHAVLLLAVIILLPACGENKKLDDSLIVPDNALVSILTDIYLTEGLFDVPEIRDMYRYRDSISNVRDILGKYGYTNAQLDSTLKYYFLYKPKKLEKIYDRVTGRLLEMEAILAKERDNSEEMSGTNGMNNLWNGKPSYVFPDDYLTDSIPFSIPLTGPGIYRFKAYYILFEDDQSTDPEVVIYFSSMEDGKEIRIMWDQMRLVKNGESNLVQLENRLDLTTPVTLKGCLFHHSNKGKKWQKHARIMGIIVEKEELKPQQQMPLEEKQMKQKPMEQKPVEQKPVEQKPGSQNPHVLKKETIVMQ